MKKLKFGIIGAGRIGKIHADNLIRHPQAEILAVSDLFAGPELEEWAGSRGIAIVTKDSEEILNHPEIDAVFICSSTDTHVPLIKKAAEQGKHIFCEKPLSMDIRQTEEAIEAVSKAGVQLQVGFNRRFDHNFKRVREHVQNGAIGDTQLIKITSRDPGPPPEAYIKVSGGIFMDMMIHDFDMARFLSDSEVEEVYTQGSVLIDPVFGLYGDVDTAIVTLRFANGALGVIDCSRKAAYGYDQRVEVFGSKGSVTAANDFPNTAVLSTEDGIQSDKPLHFFLERYNAAYVDETQQFIDTLLLGKAVSVNGNDGWQAERIARAAKLSLQENRPVKLSELQ
ncbi:inositol 2-dehydrogenase [Bacillus sp. FJAT-27264]|uniref:inositol 2-dehydrogenase n=1 Tax=Paenibacillus sp. (strain DSM 101736 / FJAT-27264) TaxID=1850362 RepID=UPI000807A86F|nr:inositol 2-dehydrogenase [Bacillus sp. FJAT-27264]OBZ18609.1 inositol 2-dehydrogenase [Bacillus sp. FJAT-27264]